MTPAELSTALVRTTLAASAAACLAGLLLAWLKVESPRIHRAAWALVVLQGWLLLPWTFEIESPPTPAAPRPTFVGGAAYVDATLLGNTPPATYTLPTVDAGAAPLRILPLAILAWIAGAVLLALAALGRYVRIVRALPLGTAIDSPTWQREWQRQRAAMDVRSRVDFRLTDRLGPLVAYIPFAYLLLAPRTVWTALTPPERVAILRHELAHIRRRDLWKSLALRVLALPQWFNPLVWLAIRRFDEAAEWACDAAACSTACDRPAVAGALLHTAELTASHAAPRAAGLISAVPSANQRRRSSAFSRRIRRLVAPSLKEESTMKKLIVPALLAIIAAGQLVRVERVVAKPAEEKLSLADDETKAGPYAATNPAKRREYVESVWPRYVIEPPDILSIEGVKLVPKSPHQLEPFDVVLVRVQGAFPEQPIDDTYSIDADGSVNLGPSYGRIKIAGDTIEQAEARLREELGKKLSEVSVSASLVASAGAQQISGQHLVGPDGRVNLGIYGAVYVAGLTLEDARAAIEKKLSVQLEQPQVAVDVLAYNSKVYYVIYKGPKLGDHVTRLPITGNETVLDAVASMGGLSSIASTNMWLARPAPNGVGPEQILPVAWNDIARGESSATNYQLMPGDRLFIETRPAENNKSQSEPTTAPDSVAAIKPNSDQSLAKIAFDVSFLEDPQGTLADFGDLVKAGAMIGDTRTTRSALQVLEKNKLINSTESPRLVCEIGDGVELTGPRQTSGEHASIKVHTRRLDDTHVVVGVSVTQDGRMNRVETVVDGSNPETTIMRLNPSAAPLADQAQGAVYVVVTPKVAQ